MMFPRIAKQHSMGDSKIISAPTQLHKHGVAPCVKAFAAPPYSHLVALPCHNAPSSQRHP